MMLPKKISLLLILSLFLTHLSGQTFTNFTTTDGMVSDDVLDLAIGNNDEVWIGTQNGISKFDGSNWTNFTTTDGLVDNAVEAIFVDGNGNMWAGTSFGLSKFDGSSWTTYTETDGLGDNRVYCINEDASGNMIFGTIDGFSVFDGSNWTSYGIADGLPFGGVNCITFAANGDYYLGSGLGGMIIFDGSGFTEITETDGLVDDKVRAIAIDGQGQRWVGTSSGISVFNSSNQHNSNHTRLFTLPAPDTLNPIEDLKIDSQGNIWAGVYVDYLVTEGGISWYNGAQWVQYEVTDGLAGPVVRSIEIDSQDNVWVGTSTGLSKITNVPGAVDQATGFSGVTVYPNPCAAVSKLTFELAQTSDLELNLLDVSGRKLETISRSGLPAGVQTLGLETDLLPSGLYFLQLQIRNSSGFFRITEKLIRE